MFCVIWKKNLTEVVEMRNKEPSITGVLNATFVENVDARKVVPKYFKISMANTGFMEGRVLQSPVRIPFLRSAVLAGGGDLVASRYGLIPQPKIYNISEDCLHVN
jgi:hypothetical protein